MKHFNQKSDAMDSSRNNSNMSRQQDNPLSKLSQFESQIKNKL